jgi:hypothetical protein
MSQKYKSIHYITQQTQSERMLLMYGGLYEMNGSIVETDNGKLWRQG